MREYAQKRNFALTPEPAFAPNYETARRMGEPVFVVQRHAARRLHHDLRLELDGALKSWAVPKGPSLDPKVRRQAVMVEDHPLDYAEFEGVIPAGEYGGGEVVVWDEGTYTVEGATGDALRDAELARRGLSQGKLSFKLHGSRLRGDFTLVRTKDDAWLLMKRKDEYSTDADPTTDGTSIRSGRTTDDLRVGREASVVGDLLEIPGAKSRTLAPVLAPMVPTEAPRPFASDLWSWEPKLDGIRVLATKEGSAVTLRSRTGQDITSRFPKVAEDVRALKERSFTLDGEIVLLDDGGRPSFEGLMQVFQSGRDNRSPRLNYFVFDALHLDHVDLRRCALSERRAALGRVELSGSLRRLDAFGGDGQALYERAAELGFEGVVGKKLSSLYFEGTRTEEWLKVKGYHTEEFLICGYTEGTGERVHTLGALLLGRRDDEGVMRFCGSVGSGFSEAQLPSLRKILNAEKTTACPFGEAITTKGRPTFVRPNRVAEIRFMNWTVQRRLRAPVFVRLRPDLEGTSPISISATVGGSGEAESVIEALETAGDEATIAVDGHPMKFTSLSKDLWPGLTKRDLLIYYAQACEPLVAHLRDRPLTVVRFPDGVRGEGFYQRHWDDGAPEFAQSVEVYSESAKGPRRHLMCNNLPTLLWLGQMGALELHPWHATTEVDAGSLGLGGRFDTEEELEDSVLDHPDYIACDLDPNIDGSDEEGGFTEEGWQRTVRVALGLRDLLGSLRLVGYPKTTGKSGIHVFVPVRRIYTHDQAREACRTLGRFLMESLPADITMERSLKKRPKGKIFFDADMNGRGKTLAGAFSPRPVAGGCVSCPLTWDELAASDPRDFTIRTVPARLATIGDAWAGMKGAEQTLGAP